MGSSEATGCGAEGGWTETKGKGVFELTLDDIGVGARTT